MSLFLGMSLLLSLPASASDLDALLKTKQENYSTMLKYYQGLSTLADRNMQKEFCATIEPMQPLLTKMLRDDGNLIFALFAVSEPDSYDYARHLDENSLTDLMAFNIHQERCRDGTFDPIAEWQQGLRYSITNVEYLSLTHRLWMEK